MKILLTGATGFLGAQIARTLLDDGNSVIALTRRPDKYLKLKKWCGAGKEHLFLLEGDILTLNSFEDGIDAIIHAAARREPLEGDADAFIKDNVQGTANLLNIALAKGIRRFVFISSQSVYGSLNPPWNENRLPQPEGVYAESKHEAEKLVKNYSKLLGYIILRPSRIYGESLFMRQQEILHKFAVLVRNGQPLPIYGDGNQRYDFIHVKDVVASVCHSLGVYPEGWNGVYNVGGGSSASLNEITACFSRLAIELGLPPVWAEFHLEAGTTSPQHLELDTSLILQKLGWQPQWSLEDGLRELLLAASA